MGALGQIKRAGVLLALVLVMGGCTAPAEITGLRPLYPEASTGWAEVETLRPTLRWEKFPRPRDLKTGGGEPAKGVRNVTYELRIWRGDRRRPLELVFQRKGLTAPEHQLAKPLAPGTRYFWTVRARFESGGNPRVLEWGVRRRSLGMAGRGRRWPVVPNPFFYRFNTPSKG